jgi:hypothetical protein
MGEIAAESNRSLTACKPLSLDRDIAFGKNFSGPPENPVDIPPDSRHPPWLESTSVPGGSAKTSNSARYCEPRCGRSVRLRVGGEPSENRTEGRTGLVRLVPSAPAQNLRPKGRAATLKRSETTLGEASICCVANAGVKVRLSLVSKATPKGKQDLRGSSARNVGEELTPANRDASSPSSQKGFELRFVAVPSRVPLILASFMTCMNLVSNSSAASRGP